MKKTTVLLLIATIALCCKKKDLCPATYSLGSFKMPEYIKGFIKYDHVDTLVFISETQDTITFLKTLEENFNVESALDRVVPCSVEDSTMVELVYVQEVSRYDFKSDSGERIHFQYYPRINRVLHNLSEAYKANIEDPQYYHNIQIILPDSETNIYEGRAEFEDPELNESFALPLPGPFTVSNISYNNVFYLDHSNQKVIFYDDINGLIGFTDKNGLRWIRKK